MSTVSRLYSVISGWIRGPAPTFRPTFRAIHPSQSAYHGQPFTPIKQEYAEHQGFFWLVRFRDGAEEWVEEACVIIV